MYEPMVKGICGAHRVHTNPSKEEEKKGAWRWNASREADDIEDGLREFQL